MMLESDEDSMEQLKLLSKNRIVIFVLFFAVFMTVTYIVTGSLLPTTETKDLWFYSGIFLLLFSILFIEPYYSSPKNVIANIVPLLILFLSIKNDFGSQTQWWIIISIIILLLTVAIVSMSLSDKNKSEAALVNVWSEKLKNIAVLIGKAKVLYSGVFLYFLFTYHVYAKPIGGYIFFLLVLWAVILLINPKELSNIFIYRTRKKDEYAIGNIFSVQSKNVFLVKLFDDQKSIKRFDIVKFKYSMQDDDKKISAGIVVDYYLLNQEKWAKVVELSTIDPRIGQTLTKNTVYKIEKDKKQDLTKKLRVDEFVGLVVEGSTIAKIKFEYSKSNDNLQEGDLLELSVGDNKIFYQVIAGTTYIEKLEARNESGFITGEAVQLGEWDSKNASFKKFGWVPKVNSVVFMGATSDIKVASISYPEYQLGTIPGTKLPSIINLDDAISHHTALIGVTGSGKSHLANAMINELRADTKVICVDFTGEWKKKILDHVVINKDNIQAFFDGDENFAIVELPNMSNTVEVIEATAKLLGTVFDYAKKSYEANDQKKICIVLEEAHTIVPETSFLGVNNWDSKAVVNKMGQIGLQGRKYGVGLLVIAQRTANVSKTILTQCNTVICFQAFDETSFNFLGNYVGKEMAQALPNLKQYHAIVTGKAIKSNIPMIVNLEKK